MKREWKPGDLAALGSGGRYLRVSENCGNAFHDYAMSDHWHSLDGPTWASNGNQAARPLAVIDPGDRAQVERLLHLFIRDVNTTTNGMLRSSDSQRCDSLQAALREFANPTPPKPDEPQGLGAVVEDAKGLRWTRAGSSPLDGNWLRTGSNVYVDYIDVAAVRVLSEGVS